MGFMNHTQAKINEVYLNIEVTSVSIKQSLFCIPCICNEELKIVFIQCKRVETLKHWEFLWDFISRVCVLSSADVSTVEKTQRLRARNMQNIKQT